MKSTGLILASMAFFGLSSGAVFANPAVTDLHETAEVLNVLKHCEKEYVQALHLADRVGSVKRSQDRDSKVTNWTITVVSGGYMPGPPTRSVATLSITRTLVIEHHPQTDAPAPLVYECKLEKVEK